MFRRRALAALLLLAPAVASLSSRPTRTGELILDGVRVLGEDGPEPAKRDWSACIVKADLIQTGAGGSRTLLSEERLLIQGETLDLEDTLSLSDGRRQSLLSFRVRIRATAVLPDGVMYLVTSEGALQAAVGFSPAESARTQVRHDFLELKGTVAHLREVYASPELGLRVLLAVSATPIDDAVEEPLVPLPPSASDILQLRVETRRRSSGGETTLRSVVLQAGLGRAASLSIVLRNAQGPPPDAEPVDPAYPYGRSVSVADIGYAPPDSGYGDRHVVQRRAVDQDYLARNRVGADQSYIERHAVEMGDGPERFTMREQKRRRLSKRKQQELRDAAEIQAVQEMALERQRTLPGKEGAPAPRPVGERLELSLKPLHSTGSHLRLELRIVGALSLGPDRPPTPVDLTFVENVAWGATFEIPLRETLEGGEPEDDTIVAITPQP